MQLTDLRTAIGPPIRTILSHCATALTEADLDRLVHAFRASYDAEGWRQTLHFPGSSDTLRQAHALGIQLFVVSNKPRHISLAVLDRESILPLFTSVLTRDSAEPPFANKSSMMQHLIQQFQLEPARCVMVGDTAEDAHAAAAMLIPFVLMTHGYGDIPLESPLPVAHRVHSFPELLPAITKEPAQ